jgi:hypothetical protein
MQGLWHENREMRSLGRFLLKPPIPHKGSDNKNLIGSAYYRGEHPLLALAHPNDPSQFIYYFISQRRYSMMSSITGTEWPYRGEMGVRMR